MRKHFWPVVALLVTLFALGAFPLAGDYGTAEPAGAQATTPTTAPTATATPSATPTLLPDLKLTVSANFDPVMAGQILTYFVTVVNDGDVVAGASTLTALIPPGTTVNSLATGCTEDTANQQVRCRLLPLAPGEQRNLALNFSVSATGGSLFNRFVVDADNAVVEVNETNNIADLSVAVTPISPVPAASVAPTAVPPTLTPTPTPVVPQPTVAPPTPTAVPAPPQPAPPAGQLWLQVLQPTPVLSFEGDEMWTAQPGEWYYVLQQDADWVFAAWEGDPPDAGGWIQLDGRVQTSY